MTFPIAEDLTGTSLLTCDILYRRAPPTFQLIWLLFFIYVWTRTPLVFSVYL